MTWNKCQGNLKILYRIVSRSPNGILRILRFLRSEAGKVKKLREFSNTTN